MARLYRPDGTQEDVTPADGRTFSLEELHALVGGYIEIVGLGHTANGSMLAFIVDEDGKRKDYPCNPRATALWHARRAHQNADVIVGAALLCTITRAGEDDERMF